VEAGLSPRLPYSGPRITDERALLVALQERATARSSQIHGPRHWQATAIIGLHLAARASGADPTVCLLFGLLHDAMRLANGHDPEHGRRARALARELRGEVFDLSDGQMATLEFALARHSDGTLTDDPTIGCCWDADRLDL
jgi:uncharacterized protein